MDQVIFEEFKGTGNMELTLDRNLANQRIYPALNIPQSGTRKEEKLLDPTQLNAARALRRHLLNMQPAQAMTTLLDVLKKHKTNDAMFATMKPRRRVLNSSPGTLILSMGPAIRSRALPLRRA
jgi:transcription termination factor Rho